MAKLMAANWKMYKTRTDACETLTALCALLQQSPMAQEREVLIFSPFTAIAEAVKVVEQCGNGIQLSLGAQNFYPAVEGAFTGEISPAMLKDVGATWVLVGHSERRHVFGESLSLVQDKTAYALEQGFNVVFCVGESLEEREAGKLEAILTQQLASLASLKEKLNAQNFAIAYEPVWAIGTGKVAGEQEILEAHAIVRKILQNIFSEKGSQLRILYGGSVKPDNAAAIVALDNVDGVLVGGASLQAESFARIVTA